MKPSEKQQRYSKGKRKDGTDRESRHQQVRNEHEGRGDNRNGFATSITETGKNDVCREEENQKGSHPAVEQKEDEELLVLIPYAIAHPRAMMIHVHNAHLREKKNGKPTLHTLQWWQRGGFF
mgnify:CR=1 FL=1